MKKLLLIILSLPTLAFAQNYYGLPASNPYVAQPYVVIVPQYPTNSLNAEIQLRYESGRLISQGLQNQILEQQLNRNQYGAASLGQPAVNEPDGKFDIDF